MTQWIIQDVVRDEAAQIYEHSLAGRTPDDARKAVEIQMIESGILADIRDLVNAGAVVPRLPDSDAKPDALIPFNHGWRLTRDDLETVLGFIRLGEEGKRDELFKRQSLNDEGRYTLRQAAFQIASGAGEQYHEILKALLAGAAANIETPAFLPTYEPGRSQRLCYRSGPPTRGASEEAYWDDLNAWLERNEPRINWHFHAPAYAPSAEIAAETASKPIARPSKQSVHQENEILRVLAELGCDPLQLPLNPGGKKGIKADVRGKLSYFSVKVFDKAWQRLRSQNRIADATE